MKRTIFNKVKGVRKQILHFSLFTFTLSIALTSCLNLDPKDSMGDNLVWDKADNFQLFANQFYGWTRDLGNGTDYQNGLSDGVHSDYRSDLVCTSSVNTYSQGTNAIPEKDGNFTSLYKRIYYTNLLLKNAEGFGNKASISNAMGEAYWFRAYLHFELVQIYGDAQILTEPLDIDNAQLYGSRNPRGEVIDQCISDLQHAIELLPETAKEEGRLCKDAAYAMLSRVALYEGTWQKFHGATGSATVPAGSSAGRATELLTIAKNAAKQVIDNQHYSLFYNAGLVNAAISNINQSYRYMFILEDVQDNPLNLLKKDNTEYIFSHRHRDSDKMILNVTHAMAANVCYVTRKMANMYLCSDGLPVEKSPLFQGYTQAASEFMNRDARMDNTMAWHGEQTWDNEEKTCRTTWNDDDLTTAKACNARSNSGYQTQKWAVECKVADYYESMDYPVIRYAEVLLNYAEAAYELNESISDQDLDISLNLVRRRVNPTMPKLSNSFVTSNGLNMREEIRRERTVELFLEGFRIDDLKRWKTAETEMPQDQLGVKMTGTWFENNWTGQKRPLNTEGCIIMYEGRTWDQKHYLYPLPQDQRQLNPNLTQNPGWE
ncbi:MAG: RagB/SusD family nutrient uptake outer membrane protein [Prevotella sp.]|nr:RagB/SusD family nutrient uptake outer membrane protein [Prevotella sp.]